ncbi:MAG TPA: twin-arginine translocase TatA/TatE family subunit [Pseudomonadales bacterium]|nr:twin-arginine translocase TatA/TatE family subunit [Pseudomonadales bacterium]
MRIGPFGVWEILIILVVVLLIFGPRRLPEMAKGLGQSVRAFRKELRDMKADLDGDDERPASKPQQPSAATVASQEPPPAKADTKEGGNATS